MARQLTTSVSDAFLTWSVLYFIYNVFWINFFACVGLGIQGVAAALGVARFAQARQEGQIYDYHMMAAWLARVLGVPLLAVGFCHKELPIMMNLNIMFMMGVLLGNRLLAPGMRKLIVEACSGFGMLTIIIVSLRTWNIYGVLAAAVYIVSGLMIGSEGKLGMVYRVDLLHVGLLVGNILFTWAVLNL
ncbi:uncharacterized protein LOC101857169 [Aplysia californica]|uniref:Uncharacterized protein LOC101857169 n=1 Tax=Aplysia californica TaxID=6500 RepID=A0ABM0JET7_APLCA|nr:uncharacterized protein LOC101857169 [Aplysia californica]XP_005092100.1 uncharacterized protein LOC101857169 [Aplysia californica]